MHCVCALVRMAGAGCSAVLGSFSLSALTPLLPPGIGGRGARVPPGRGLYLTPFARLWVLAGVDVVWMLSCASGLYSRKSCLHYIFINICGFGRRFPLLYSHRHLGSAPRVTYFYLYNNQLSWDEMLLFFTLIEFLELTKGF